MNQNQLDVCQISFAYEKEKEILSDITFHVKEREAVGLIGANGVGKSTLLKILVGLNLGFTGTVTIDGILLEKRSLPEIRAKLGFVFQDSDSQLFMNTVYEEIAFAPRNYELSEAVIKERVEKAMEMTGIAGLEEKPIYHLSGGEKKLVSIASVLSMQPDIMLLDEPSIALDPRNRRRLIGLLNRMDCVKLIASHDLDLIMDTCRRTLLLADGRLIKDGPTEEVLTDAELLEEYGLELPLGLQGRRRERT